MRDMIIPRRLCFYESYPVLGRPRFTPAQEDYVNHLSKVLSC